jgi:hypothetical protein
MQARTFAANVFTAMKLVDHNYFSAPLAHAQQGGLIGRGAHAA